MFAVVANQKAGELHLGGFDQNAAREREYVCIYVCVCVCVCMYVYVI